ncbi:MAG: hypothetical protein ACK4RK_10785 [Gemmataceae bacterium]
MNHLKQYYGPTEGPLGIPCTDKQARALEELLRTLPREDAYAPGKAYIPQATTELLPGERADVSWISTEHPDRQKDVVLAAGMRDDHFQLNPIVTLQHAYWLPPVGRSLWRKRIRAGSIHGIKAKTRYPERPSSWTSADWPPDVAFLLVQSGLLAGKSIGFLPTKVRAPTEAEVRARPEWANVRRIIEEWVLLEYACVYIPAQPQAVVEAVSKGLPIPLPFQKALGLEEELRAATYSAVPFTPWEEVQKYIDRTLAAIHWEQLADTLVQRIRATIWGRV